MRRTGSVLLALFAGCAVESTPPTEIIVTVDTDYLVPEEIGSILASVEFAPQGPGNLFTTHTFQLAPRGAATPPQTIDVPFSFAIEPGPRHVDQRVSVHLGPASGSHTIDPEHHTNPHDFKITKFIAGRSLVLPMFISRDCTGVWSSCTVGQTCREGLCEDAFVDPASLADVVPGRELPDGGPRSFEPRDSGLEDALPGDALPREAGPEDALWPRG
jgi:hypothetical protein